MTISVTKLADNLLILIKKEPHFLDQPKRHLKAIVISWAILVALFFSILPVEDSVRPLYKWISNKTDVFISINAGVDATDDIHAHIPSLELYDIDDATYRGWNFPATIPRDKLAKLITRAVDGGAAVIAVDVDLTFPDNKQEDDRLGRLLQILNESSDPESPIVILTRRLLRPLDEKNKVNSKAVFSLPASFLDQYLPTQKKVFWSSTLFSIDEDHVVRRWRHAEVYCAPDKTFKILPSLQLISTIAINSKLHNVDPALELQLLSEKISGLSAARKCSGYETIPSLNDFLATYPLEAIVKISPADTHQIDLRNFGEAERINYRISPDVEGNAKNQIVVTSVGLLENSPVKLDVLGRLVLIGATYEESNDFHVSPISNSSIPGVYVLANAIDSLQTMRGDSLIFLIMGPIIILVMLVIGAFLAERKAKFVWIGTTFVMFIAVGLMGYSPGKGAAALPFAVILVGFWFMLLDAGGKICRGEDDEND